jgi:glycosyltransferase involved in cell wall biosynthesis
MKNSDTVILHDAFAFKGGGERLVNMVCRDLKADLVFGYRNKSAFNLDDLPNKLINLDSESNLPVWRTIKRFHAFRNKTKFLNDYKNVIYTGHNSPLAVSNHSKGKNIYYCLTPPRSIYDLKESHLASQTPLGRLRHELYNAFHKPLYENAIRKMDLILADSKNVQNRIQKFLGLESTVLYPPCDVDKFNWMGQEDYYLSTARLTSYKRVDIIIQAFIKLPQKRLIITSTGPDEKKLKQLAEGFANIQFTGDINDNELKNLIGNSIATIYIPKDEDFGISPVESMAAGKPVIGSGEGGLLETVIHGETGWLSSPNISVEELVQMLDAANPKLAHSMRFSCEKQATGFRTELFINKIKDSLR